MSSTMAYMIGFIVLTVGICLGAYYVGLAPRWIAVIAITLTGIGIMAAYTRTRQKEPPTGN